MIIEAREDTITLRGEIKSNIWPAIQAAATLLLESHPTGILIDASAVTKVTPKGAETFGDAFAYIRSHNARIVVVGLAPQLQEIGKAVPVVRAELPLADSIEEARASLQIDEAVPQRGRARMAGVVPMLGNWHRAVYHADRLAMGTDCEIHLVDLIKVPRTLPIGTPLPQRESDGQQRLEAAAEVVRQTRLKSYTHAERVRGESSGLVRFAQRLGADFAVVSLDEAGTGEPSIEESEAMALVEAADFEVSLIKGASSDEAAMPKHVVVPAVGAWEHAAEHACKLVHRENAVVTVIYLITVPRAEPIEIPKPDAEAAASDCANEAQRIGRRYGVSVEPVSERVRDPILGFLRVLESRACGLVVVGVKRETTGDYHIAHAIASALLHQLPCEIAFLRVGG